MDAIARLGYVGFEVSGLDQWRRFAVDVLGLGIGPGRADGSLPLRMDGHRHRVVLHQGPADDVAYIGWEAADAAALDAVADRLVRAHVPVRPGTAAEAASREVASLISFDDPDGIRSEIFFGPRLASEPFRSPLVASGFRTGELGMGHVLTIARDGAKTEAFYRDILGFRLSDYVDTSFGGQDIHAVFLNVNARHHSFAFCEFPTPKRLNHFMIEVNSVDDVGAAYYRAQDMGVPIALTLGRHQNDGTLSFYGVTPSGFWFEVGWGGREVDERWEVKTYHAASDWGHRPVATA